MQGEIHYLSIRFCTSYLCLSARRRLRATSSMWRHENDRHKYTDWPCLQGAGQQKAAWPWGKKGDLSQPTLSFSWEECPSNANLTTSMCNQHNTCLNTDRRKPPLVQLNPKQDTAGQTRGSKISCVCVCVCAYACTHMCVHTHALLLYLRN